MEKRETRNEEARREERGKEEIFASLTDGRPLS